MTFIKYLRIDFISFHGREFYCILSVLRVYGITMMEDLKSHFKEEHNSTMFSTPLQYEDHSVPLIQDKAPAPSFCPAKQSVFNDKCGKEERPLEPASDSNIFKSIMKRLNFMEKQSSSFFSAIGKIERAFVMRERHHVTSFIQFIEDRGTKDCKFSTWSHQWNF